MDSRQRRLLRMRSAACVKTIKAARVPSSSSPVRPATSTMDHSGFFIDRSGAPPPFLVSPGAVTPPPFPPPPPPAPPCGYPYHQPGPPMAKQGTGREARDGNWPYSVPVVPGGPWMVPLGVQVKSGVHYKGYNPTISGVNY